MPKKRIDVTVTSPGILQPEYYALARNERGDQVAYAYGKDRREAIANAVQKVRQMYGSDAEILY